MLTARLLELIGAGHAEAFLITLVTILLTLLIVCSETTFHFLEETIPINLHAATHFSSLMKCFVNVYAAITSVLQWQRFVFSLTALQIYLRETPCARRKCLKVSTFAVCNTRMVAWLSSQKPFPSQPIPQIPLRDRQHLGGMDW